MGSFFTSLENSIKAAIANLGQQIAKVATHFKPMVIATAEELGTLALQEVLTQAPLVLSGQEKMAAAVANVKLTLAASGKAAALTLIQAAIQEAHDQVAIAVAAKP